MAWVLVVAVTPITAHAANDELTLDDATTVPTKPIKKPSTKRKRSPRREPADVATSRVPLLPDGTPDFSKFPNPFIVKRWTFDLGASSGTAITPAASSDYSEIGLGVNAVFYDFLAWRNAVFSRIDSTGSSVFGLDTSERLIYRPFQTPNFMIFAAPGFRFATTVGNTPFAEAGISCAIASAVVSAGARELLGSWIVTGRPNETQFFFQIGSGGRP